MTEHDKLVDNLIADYLKKAMPKTIHQMAMEWNWDTSDHFFDFIVDNPNTDKATILMIYWMAGPRFEKQFATKEESQQRMGSCSTFVLLEKIESNFQKGFYNSNEFFYDPNSEDHTGTIWTMQDLEIKTVRDIPDIMFQKLDGEVIETNNNFDEGIPPELFEQIEALD
jgi:Domain of unknown function (DUF4274)